MDSYDVVIVGGGAAGLMCAITAGKRGRRTLVLEGSNKIGKKILMSGGGRCNFTNLHCTPDNFISANRRFSISALSRYTPADFVALVEKHDIAYHEKTAGQLFCDRSSKDILAMLAHECDAAGVDIMTHCDISSVTTNRTYQLMTSKGRFACESLVIASGGLSIPKMGASDFGFRVARQFDIGVRDTSAALVPFTFTGETHALTMRLSGVSVRATVAAGPVGQVLAVPREHRLVEPGMDEGVGRRVGRRTGDEPRPGCVVDRHGGVDQRDRGDALGVEEVIGRMCVGDQRAAARRRRAGDDHVVTSNAP